MSKTQTVIQYLDKLTKDDLLCIIKYGLRGSNAPNDVDVEDIYEKIGCEYIGETNLWNICKFKINNISLHCN